MKQSRARQNQLGGARQGLNQARGSPELATAHGERPFSNFSGSAPPARLLAKIYTRVWHSLSPFRRIANSKAFQPLSCPETPIQSLRPTVSIHSRILPAPPIQHDFLRRFTRGFGILCPNSVAWPISRLAWPHSRPNAPAQLAMTHGEHPCTHSSTPAHPAWHLAKIYTRVWRFLSTFRRSPNSKAV
jgi:hypothetical protein